MNETTIRIGTLVRGFGIKGEVKVRILTDFPMERFKPGKVLIHELEGKQIELTVETVRFHQEHALIKFVGYPDLTSVEPLIKGDLRVEAKELESKDTILYFQLLDCAVYTESRLIGRVSEVFDNGRHPILRVKTDGKDVLIPYVKAFIAAVDVDAKTIQVNWMEGL